MDAPKPEAIDTESPPPILRRWRNVYLLVVGELAVLVVLFYLLRQWAS
jgi:hypothetical protein